MMMVGINKRIVFLYAGKFLADNGDINDLSDLALDKAFCNCVMHTKIKRYYPQVRDAIKKLIKDNLEGE